MTLQTTTVVAEDSAPKAQAALRSGPDFMCIGLQKAGTGWLYDQLDSHPDFELPPVKELHYFDTRLKAPGLNKLHNRVQQNLEKLNHWRRRQGKRAMSSTDLDFIRDAMRVRDQAGGIDDYAALFAGRGLTGDVTPAYSTLPVETVRQVARRFPDLKVVLLLREPVSRVTSHLAMMVERGYLPPEATDSVARAAEWFAKPEVQGRSHPSIAWGRWSGVFPREQIRFFFFEDLCERPDWLIGRIVEFLGADSAKRVTLPADYNRKGGRRTEVAAKVRGYFADALAGEIEVCAGLFGGHAAEWPERARPRASPA